MCAVSAFFCAFSVLFIVSDILQPSNVCIVANQWTWWEINGLSVRKLVLCKNVPFFIHTHTNTHAQNRSETERKKTTTMLELRGNILGTLPLASLVFVDFSAKFNTPTGYTLFHLKTRHQQTNDKCILICFMCPLIYIHVYVYDVCNKCKTFSSVEAKQKSSTRTLNTIFSFWFTSTINIIIHLKRKKLRLANSLSPKSIIIEAGKRIGKSTFREERVWVLA